MVKKKRESGEPTASRVPAIKIKKAPAITDWDLLRKALNLLDQFDSAGNAEKWNENNAAWWLHWMPDETMRMSEGTTTHKRTRGDDTRIHRLAELIEEFAADLLPPAPEPRRLLLRSVREERHQQARAAAMDLLSGMEDPAHRRGVRKVIEGILEETEPMLLTRSIAILRRWRNQNMAVEWGRYAAEWEAYWTPDRKRRMVQGPSRLAESADEVDGLVVDALNPKLRSFVLERLLAKRERLIPPTSKDSIHPQGIASTASFGEPYVFNEDQAKAWAKDRAAAEQIRKEKERLAADAPQPIREINAEDEKGGDGVVQKHSPRLCAELSEKEKDLLRAMAQKGRDWPWKLKTIAKILGYDSITGNVRKLVQKLQVDGYIGQECKGASRKFIKLPDDWPHDDAVSPLLT